MAKAEDHFYAFGSIFEVVAVVKETLGFVRDNLWREEGLLSPEDFVREWNSIHPHKTFTPTTVVHLYWFHMKEQ